MPVCKTRSSPGTHRESQPEQAGNHPGCKMRLLLQVSHVMQVLTCFSGQQSLGSLPKSTGIEMIFFLAMAERCLSNPKHQRNTHSEQAGDHPGCLCLLKNEVSSASITCHASFSLRSRRLEEIGAKTNQIHVREVCRVSRVSLARPVFSCACYFRLLRKLLGIE